MYSISWIVIQLIDFNKVKWNQQIVRTNQPIEFTYDQAILAGLSENEVTLEISDCEKKWNKFGKLSLFGLHNVQLVIEDL